MSSVPRSREQGSSVERIPMYFGPRDRALFGWYHVAPEATQGALAVVVCPPLDHEYMNSHRAIRHLADRLAGAGIPALRFDYHGAGDSSGFNEDPARMTAWLESIEEAVRALRIESGCSEVGLVGLRMGATLAALASRVVDVSRLVLWAPCVRGRTYIRELKALDLTGDGSAQRSRSLSRIEAGGFVTSEETQKDIGAINLEDGVPKAGRVLIVSRDDLPAGHRLQERWLTAGLAVDQCTLPGYADMLAVPHQTRVPDSAVAEIVRWLSDGESRANATRAVTSADAGRPETNKSSMLVENVRESFVRAGENGELFGVLSAREDASLAVTPVVLLPNAGSTHHVGPSRLYVLLARRLAQAGFRCVRFDLPGLGDSVTGNRDDENNPYVPEASLAIASVIKAVSGKNADAYVLMGLCSGAHTAFHAALDLDRSPIVESILINPLTFYYTPGMSLDQPAWHNGAGWRRFVQVFGSSQGLARLFSTDISRIASALSVQLRTIVTETMENLNLVGGKTRADRAGAGDLAADITRLVARQRRLTFVFSMHDPGYHLLMSMARKVVKPLRRQGAVKLWIIKGANHTFEQKIPREEMIDSIVAHLTTAHPPAQTQRRQAAV